LGQGFIFSGCSRSPENKLRIQEVKFAGSLLPDDSESKAVTPGHRLVIGAVSTSLVFTVLKPSTTSDHPVFPFCFQRICNAVNIGAGNGSCACTPQCAPLAGILDPFLNISVHVVKPPFIGFKKLDGMGFEIACR
jgi:hypothetical protein